MIAEDFGNGSIIVDEIAPSTTAAPRRSTLSLNMRSSEHVVVRVPELTTYMATLPLETGATALRIGLANTTRKPYQIDGICVCEAAQWTPPAATAWSYFTVSGPPDEPRPPGSFPSQFIVPGNEVDEVTGSAFVPKIMWSDWMRFSSLAATPQLLFRSLVPKQRAVLAFPAFPKLPDLGQRRRWRAQAIVRGDYVTDPTIPLPQTEPTPHSPVYVVQYRATTPGIQIVVGGDSHLAPGNSFVQMAAARLSVPSLPMAVWNTAWHGRASKTFWPALNHALNAAPPSFTIIQGWTANDGMTPQADQAYLGRVKESAERTIAAGGIPIIIKGLPRHLFGKAELRSWQNINAQIDTLVPRALVFDPSPYVEDPNRPGDWLSGLSDDKVHPNMRGNLALYEPFKNLLIPHL